jgi:hypothetical protein
VDDHKRHIEAHEAYLSFYKPIIEKLHYSEAEEEEEEQEPTIIEFSLGEGGR